MMKVRMLVLLDVLHELTDEEHILNSQSLVAELDKRGYSTDRRSVYRDVEALCEYGVDVVEVPGSAILASSLKEDSTVENLGEIAGETYGNLDYLSEADWMPKDLLH